MALLQAYAPAEPFVGRNEVLRWSGAAAVVLLVHVVVVAALLRPSEDADVEAGSPVALIELAPLAAAPPAPESDLAPGPEQQQAESREAVREETEVKPPEIEPPPEAATPDPAVTLPPPEPPKEVAKEEVQQEPQEAAPVPTAPVSAATPAPRAAAPPVGRVARPNAAAVMTWQRSLVAHLQRYKRYPPRAQERHEQGTASLTFTMDRQGHVLSSRILRSSGSALLDEETLAMIRRAQPLPAPPPGVAGDKLAFVVPIRYSVR